MEKVKSFNAFYKSYEIVSLIYPKNHPDYSQRLATLGYYYYDLEFFPTAAELIENSIKVSLQNLDENDARLNKNFLALSEIYLKAYNINNAIVNYEKSIACFKNIKSKDPQNDKYLKYHEETLEGMKQVSEELKKKGLKGKEGSKKAFEELVNKHIYKAQDQLDLRLLGNQQLNTEENNLKLLDYMIKNGLIRMPDLNNNKVFSEGIESDKVSSQKEKNLSDKKSEVKQEGNKGNKGK